MCALRSTLACRSAVCLVMAPFEPLKPSNTGWLVADVVADTSAFLWSRTTLDPALEALLADPRRQPYLVFPGEFVEADRIVRELPGIDAPQAKPPLFVVLDGTWSEARRMFRRSPWLNRFPVLSLDATHASRYRLRQADRDHHLCTSQVVAHCLAMAGDHRAAETLEATLDVFSERYLRANQSVPADPADEAHRRLLALSEPAA
ncbi:tRNA-uridine aminocarboxypropyltransferase [soil metagenome]